MNVAGRGADAPRPIPRAVIVGREMHRAAPKFWWDFAGDSDTAVVVQGDYPGGEELARFELAHGQTSWEPLIGQAEALIADFAAGRERPARGCAARPREGHCQNAQDSCWQNSPMSGPRMSETMSMRISILCGSDSSGQPMPSMC